MRKVKFGEGDLRMAELQAELDLEKSAADDAVRKHTRILRRIDAFFEAVDYVAFSSEEEAPMWAAHWREWLQTGMFPVPDEPADELVEETDQTKTEVPPLGPADPEIGPEMDPEDEPDPPLAATG